MKPWKLQSTTKYFLFFIFLIAFLTRLSVYGVGYSYPYQAASSDAAFHIQLAADIDTYPLLPAYMAQGHTSIANVQPPLFYFVVYGISSVFHLAVWDVAYVLVALASSSMVLLLFFLTKQLFSETTALLAASFAIFPVPFSAWVGSLSNGIWLTVFAQMIVLAQLIVFLSALRSLRTKPVVFLGILAFLQFFLHIPETVLVSLLFFIVWFFLYIRHHKKRYLAHAGIYACFLAAAVALFYPQLRSVWLASKYGSMHIIPAIGETYPFLIFLMKQLSVFSFPWVMLILCVFGIVRVLRKKQWFLLFGFLYFLFFFFVPIYFVGSPEYFIKFRYLLPFLIYPFAAYALDWALHRRQRVVVPVCFLIIALSFPSYLSFAVHPYAPLSSQAYDAIQWIREHTPQNATVLYYSGVHEWSGIFAERTGFEATAALKEGSIPGTWIGHSQNLPRYDSFLHYTPLRTITRVNYLDAEEPLNQFDYIVLTDPDEFEGFSMVASFDHFRILAKANP